MHRRPGFRTRVLDSRGRARQEALSGRRSGLTRMITQRTPVRQLRSERTRKRLLDATIACLVKYGYARTNPLRVAAEAGVTRGAVLHHFRDGPDLIRGTILELQEKRMRALGRVTAIDPAQLGAIMRTYWDQLSTPTAIPFEAIRHHGRNDAALEAGSTEMNEQNQDPWACRHRETI